MTLEWLLHLAAVPLLLTPVSLFHGHKVKYRPLSLEWTQHWRQVLTFWPHSFDLIRALLGTWLLFEYQPGLLGVTEIDPRATALFQGIILAVAVSFQTLCRDKESLHAPFAFVTGILFGMFPPLAAGVAFVLAAVVAIGSFSPALYFPSLAVSVPLAALFLLGMDSLVPAALFSATAVLPWLYAMLFSHDLVITYRSGRTDEQDFEWRQ